ncbi:hypothetical protein C0995_006626 [Termitomyces sp. Mi166|nr:hypothetical protein C0995_006626 [Termitomyces sp. Mi166\
MMLDRMKSQISLIPAINSIIPEFHVLRQLGFHLATLRRSTSSYTLSGQQSRVATCSFATRYHLCLQKCSQFEIPETDTITTPTDFLKAIGRSSETKLEVEQWEALWKLSGHDLKQKGLTVRDRRYILWCMEKYRSGLSIESFAYEPRPKKTVRGWGPSVQNGKRIRSRRDKSKKK